MNYNRLDNEENAYKFQHFLKVIRNTDLQNVACYNHFETLNVYSLYFSHSQPGIPEYFDEKMFTGLAA